MSPTSAALLATSIPPPSSNGISSEGTHLAPTVANGPTGMLRPSRTTASSSSLISTAYPPANDSLLQPSPSELPSSLSSAKSEKVRRSELEAKIIREVARLFSHEMFFAYDFGKPYHTDQGTIYVHEQYSTDITTSIQRKTTKLLDRDRSNRLLGNLGAPSADEPPPLPTLPEMSAAPANIQWSPTAEPQAHLPLWRRVDRRFWWNEEALQGFVEAGVRVHGFLFSDSHYLIKSKEIPLILLIPSDRTASWLCLANHAGIHSDFFVPETFNKPGLHSYREHFRFPPEGTSTYQVADPLFL
jgi:hypothetical protein